MTLFISCALCLWVGIALGFVAGFRAWQDQRRGWSPDHRAVSATFREWQATGEVSPETREWLETGVKPSLDMTGGK